jgi:hypothetical protein
MPITYKSIIKVSQPELIVEATDGHQYKLTGGTLAWKNNNPGNLKYGDFARNFGAIGPGWEGHAVFPDFETGAIAQQELLFSDEGSYYKLTILEAISKYAPLDDPNPIAHNNPPEYATYVADHVGVSLNTVLNDLNTEQQHALLRAMCDFEGYQVGEITLVK